MKKKFSLLLLLCALAQCFLLRGASAEPDVFLDHNYPGWDEYSYWVECTMTNNWGPDYNKKSISRFSIGGTLEYVNGAFTSVSSKKNPSDAMSVRYIRKAFDLATSDVEEHLFSYTDDNVGYIFIAQGNSEYKICTSDGHYIKRTGGTTSAISPKIGSTDEEDSATVFKVQATRDGYLIYEEYKTGVGGLELGSDGNLKMKFHAYYYEVNSVQLFRKAYSPVSYLSGDIMLATSQSLTTQGPFYPGREELAIILPCYYGDVNNPDYLTNMTNMDTRIQPLSIMESVEAYYTQHYTKNNTLWYEWQVELPDAPEGMEVYTYRAYVSSIQLHWWADETVVAQEPTCTEPGYQYHPCRNYSTCHCYDEMEEIPALGHDFDEIYSERPASCTYQRSVYGHCRRCNQTGTNYYGSPLGHDYVYHAPKAPTCTEQGWQAYYSCSRCSLIFDTEYDPFGFSGTEPFIPAAGHSWGDMTYVLSTDSRTLAVGHTCTACGESETTEMNLCGNGSADEPWQIGSAACWDLFANAVQLGLDTGGKSLRLTNDISVTTMMGTSDHPFSGCFDGAGNTLTVTLTASAGGKGAFAFVSGASIEHLRVAGLITTSLSDTGGLVGQALGMCTISDCVSAVEIHVTNNSSGQAGFVGSSASGAVPSFYGSVFTGSITGTARYSAGFAGSGAGTVANCVYDGSMDSGACNSTFNRQTNSAENSYYTNLVNIASDRIKGKKACAVTAAADSGVTLDFGAPTAVYAVSGITAYATGLVYDGVFYAGPNQTVTLGLSGAPAGYAASCTADAGTLTEADGTWTLVMPDGDVTISVEFSLASFGPATFTLPAALTAIEDGAFEDSAFMTVVYVPDGCQSIGADAFRGCTGLVQIRLPQNCQIDSSAFDGCGTVYVFAPAGGTTESWCDGRTGIVFVEEQQD